MKKILLFAVALFVTVVAYAQPKGYEMNVRTGMAPDLKYSDIDLSVMFTNGYRFNQHVFLGGGAGFKVKTYVNDGNVRVSGGYFGYGSTEIYPDPTLSMAFFLNGKFNFTETRVSPYFSVDTGYVANLTGALSYEDDDYYSALDSSGFFVMPAIGFDCNIGAAKKYAIFVQTGLYIQQSPELLPWDLQDGPYTKIELSVGFRF